MVDRSNNPRKTILRLRDRCNRDLVKRSLQRHESCKSKVEWNETRGARLNGKDT